MNGKPMSSHEKSLVFAITGALGLAAALPAFAGTDVESLAREVAEQKQQIQRLLAEQEAQKKTATPGGITVYGVFDGGVEHITNVQNGATTGSVNRMPGITGTIASRLGFRAGKELQPGYKAVATLETGFNQDDGTLGQAGRIFGRQMFAGMETPYGRLTVGRQYSMLLQGLGDADFIGPNIYGMGSLDPYLPNARYDNSLAWFGRFSNLTLGATVSSGRDTKGGAPASGTCAGEVAGSNGSCAGWSGTVKYDDANWGVALAVDEQHGGPGATASFFNGSATLDFSRSKDTDRRTTAGAYVKLGAAKIGAGWLGRKLDVAAGEIESNAYYAEAAYQLSNKVSFDGAVQRMTNKDQDRDATRR
jgi:predicted porin